MHVQERPLISPHTDHGHLLVPDSLDPLKNTLSLREAALVCDGIDDDETVSLEHVLWEGGGRESELWCVLCIYIIICVLIGKSILRIYIYIYIYIYIFFFTV